MIYPNKPLYLLSLLGYIYYLTYYTLTTKDNIGSPFLRFQAAVPPFFNAPVALCALWRYVFCSACLSTQHRTKVQYLQDL